jgi:NADH-quinone oxidoreductase subunit E
MAMAEVMVENLEKSVEEVMARHGNNPARMIEILQDLQDIYGYLPEEVLKEVSRQTEVPLARVYHVATFFKAFTLKPRGKYTIQVCTGTACHVKGSYRVLERFEDVLGIKPGDTTNDLYFTLETVNCVGCCALGPVVIVNGRYYGHVSPVQVGSLIKEYKGQ